MLVQQIFSGEIRIMIDDHPSNEKEMLYKILEAAIGAYEVFEQGGPPHHLLDDKERAFAEELLIALDETEL